MTPRPHRTPILPTTPMTLYVSNVLASACQICIVHGILNVLERSSWLVLATQGEANPPVARRTEAQRTPEARLIVGCPGAARCSVGSGTGRCGPPGRHGQ